MTATGPEGDPAWLEPLRRIPREYRGGTLSVRQLFARAAAATRDSGFLSLIRSRLSSDPDLIRAWQEYSHDKRTAPSPYLEKCEVGFAEIVDGKLSLIDIRRYENPVDACADFIYREAVWVLEGRRVITAPSP